MMRRALVAMALAVSAMGAITTAPSAPVPPCAWEDGSGSSWPCRWDAATMGNRQGEGVIVYTH